MPSRLPVRSRGGPIPCGGGIVITPALFARDVQAAEQPGIPCTSSRSGVPQRNQVAARIPGLPGVCQDGGLRRVLPKSATPQVLPSAQPWPSTGEGDSVGVFGMSAGRDCLVDLHGARNLERHRVGLVANNGDEVG